MKKIFISPGDPSGIGPEITLKALAKNKSIQDHFIIGGDANYWYLMDKPAGDSLAVFMPEAPYHILGIAPLALIVFFITYVPFLLWDKFKKA